MTFKKHKSKCVGEGFVNHIPLYLMLAPFAVLFCLFIVLPVLTSIVLSLFSFDMLSVPKFVGLDNFKRMVLDDEVFPITVKNTLVFSVITGPLGFLLSFVLAWFINEFSPRVRTLLSFFFYAPALVGNAYFIWQVAFSSDSYGYMNSALLSLGFITEPVLWLQNEK